MITTKSPRPSPSRPRARPPVSAQMKKRRNRARPKLRLVQPRRPARLPFFVISLLIVGVLIAGVAGLQALVSQRSFRMQDLSNQAAQLGQQNGELRLQIAELSSPKHLEDAARRIGLQEPDPSTVAVLAVKGRR